MGYYGKMLKLCALLGGLSFIAVIISYAEALLPTHLQSSSYLAQHIISTCISVEHRFACYEREIPALMDEGVSFEEAFHIVKKVQEKDRVYRYCHALGHKLSAKETAKDLLKWRDVVARSPSGVCNNGAIHGAFQERFRKDSLPQDSVGRFKEELRGVCDSRDGWNPTPFEQGSCMHAVGHLLMYVSSADILQSLHLCDEVAHTLSGLDRRTPCYNGVFMQLFQPLEPEDFALIEGKEQGRETVMSFCSKLPKRYLAPCVTESIALFEEILLSNSHTLVSHCSILSDDTVADCEAALARYATSALNFNHEVIAKYCAALPEEHRITCFSNAALRFIQTDWTYSSVAVRMCEVSSTHGAEEECFQALIDASTYTFRKGSPQALGLCRAMRLPWGEVCRAAHGVPELQPLSFLIEPFIVRQ